MAEWVDPEDPDRTYEAIDMLDPDVVGRLQRQTVPCPVCGGSREVPKMVRIAREVPCPKDAALKMLLDENEETGRIVIFAGFTGSVDRVVKLCLKPEVERRAVRPRRVSRSSRTTAKASAKSRWTIGPTWIIRGWRSAQTRSRAA